jgi:hypothetical protein
MDMIALLHGPYAPPALRKGDRAIRNWRRAFSVTLTNSEGTKRLRHAAALRAGEATKRHV